MSIPTSATTPARPISRPTSRRPETRSDASKRSARSATISGAAAMMIAATDESTWRSPAAISGNGTAISKIANASSHRARPRSEDSVPARHASASSTTAASTTRDQARNAGGTPSSTATLMNRYGTPQIVDIAKKPAHARTLMVRGYSGGGGARELRGPPRHDLARMAVELQLLAPAEEGEAEPDQRVAHPRAVRDGGDAELDLARVEPLPHLVGHLPALEAAAQRAVVPAPDAHGPAVLLARLVDDPAHAHAEAEVEAEEAPDEHHVAPHERRVLLEDRAHRRALGERVVAHQRLRALEAPARRRVAGRLPRQRLAAVVAMPALGDDELAHAARVEVVAAAAQVLDRPGLAGI